MTDTRDFDAFYTEARQRVLRCVFLLTGDLAEAQDSVQEAFMRAWQRWDTIARYADPEAWVRLVACRIATSRWRTIRRGKTALHRYLAGTVQAIPATSALRLDIVAALRTLPKAQRLVIVLHHLAGLPLAEIAEQIGTPVGTVKARLSRGRRTLADLLALDDASEQEDAHA